MTFRLLVLAISIAAAACAAATETGVASTQTTPAASSASLTTPPPSIPKRRRIYLMRHGDVAYFDAEGKSVANSDLVTLSDKGKTQADAAGAYFKSIGVVRFDKVISSNLPRTVETADRVLAIIGQNSKPDQWPDLREMKAGKISQLNRNDIPKEMTALAQAQVSAETRFIGGESIGEAYARIFPALERLRADQTWDTSLLVLHGLVNTAIISRALTGGDTYLGHIEQRPGCINVLDMGDTNRDWIVRAVNLCPDARNYTTSRAHTLESLMEQALRGAR